MRQMSKRRLKRDAGYQRSRFAVYERSEGRCELEITPDCYRTMTDVHHRAGRGGPDPHRLDNLLGLCRLCHNYVHQWPLESYENGWMVRRNGKDLT
jgi:5-methylcytosine-specific restriction endonuclease McrA